MAEIRSELEGVMEELHTLREQMHEENAVAVFSPNFNHDRRERASLGVYLTEDGDRLVVNGFPVESAAQKSGIEQGDQIIAVDEHDFTNNHAKVELLVEYLASIEPGAEVIVKVDRDNVSMEFPVETLAMSEMFGFRDVEVMREGLMPWIHNRFIDQPEIHIERLPHQWRDQSDQSSVSVTELNPELAEYFDVETGVLVLDAAEDSELKAGDIIIRVGDIEVTSVEDLFAALRSESDLVSINRKGREMDLDYEETLTGLRLEREVTVFSKRSRDGRERRRW